MNGLIRFWEWICDKVSVKVVYYSFCIRKETSKSTKYNMNDIGVGCIT